MAEVKLAEVKMAEQMARRQQVGLGVVQNLKMEKELPC